MKKTSSVVWRFFDRLEEDNRCVAVLCKLCEQQYKYFGNTTNLRTHLTNKHPIQWDLMQNGNLDESAFHSYDGETTNQSSVQPKRRKYTRAKNVRYSVLVHDSGNLQTETNEDLIPKIEIQRVDVLDNSETDIENHGDNEDTEAAIHIVRQMRDRGSDEEWLEEDPYQTTHIEMYEPKPKKQRFTRKIKREIETPPRRMSNYVLPAPKHEKPERIRFDDAPRKDEYSVFGEYIANKLRKFKAPRTRGNIQQLITTILWQAEYGMYDDAASVKRVLMHSHIVTDQHSVQEQDPVVESQQPQGEVELGEVLVEGGTVDEQNQSGNTETIVTTN